MLNSRWLSSLVLLVCLFLTSCGTTKQIPETTIIIQDELLDTLMVTAPRKKAEEFSMARYNPSAEKKIDLIHMDLDISFDWTNESVIGNAILKLSPYFYETDIIILDAVQMNFNGIKLNGAEPLTFDYDGKVLKIQLPRIYKRSEEIILHIDYVAQPSLGRVNANGFMTDDQGLYFINSDNSELNKPQQIWTQGETENNSHWFPTRDKPNERFTHDIKMTVEDRFATLSNGFLVSSSPSTNGKRTDHWRMEKEHAPYLTMVAVGEFAVVRDKWKGKPLMYYVEKEYEQYAKQIFNHTPDMLEYFSNLTGVEYPWDQYAQVIVRDFVSGAMENTTAVTFGEFVQKTDMELIDNSNDDIVAHEMFHHWFGDYVTCESWANLTLNEGFANYSEYLWTQHKYGQVAADNKRLIEIDGYMRQAKNQGVHPLIHYSYADKENMFDAHSYNKGGLVLHLLRNKIGDNAFFAGMNKYLRDNAGSSVEVDELRMAYEETTGLDLQVFFNQWYLSSGHPELEITYDTSADNTLVIDVEQIQSPETSIAIFELDMEFDIYMKDGKIERESFLMNNRGQIQSTSIDIANIEWINFDPEHVFLGELTEQRSVDSYLAEYSNSTSQYDKREALIAIRTEQVDPGFYRDIIASETNHINKLIANSRYPYSTSDRDLYLNALKTAEFKYLQFHLLRKFTGNENDIPEATLVKIIDDQKNWSAVSMAIQLLGVKNMTKTKEYISRFSDLEDQDMVYAITSAIIGNKAFDQLPYTINLLGSQPYYAMSRYGDMLNGLFVEASPEQLVSSITAMNNDFFQSDEVSPQHKKAMAEKVMELKEMLNEESLEKCESLLRNINIYQWME